MRSGERRVRQRDLGTGAGAFAHTVRAIVQVLAVLSASAVVAIMAVTIADVARRTATGRSVPGAVDYAELLMVAAVFLGLAFAQLRREHVSVQLVTARLPTRLSRWLRLAGLVAAMGFVTWMAIATGQEALRSLDRDEFRFGLVRVSVWPARAAMTVGALALLLQLAVDATEQLRRRRQPGHLDVSTPARS